MHCNNIFEEKMYWRCIQSSLYYNIDDKYLDEIH